jgi:hypothetical protein
MENVSKLAYQINILSEVYAWIAILHVMVVHPLLLIALFVLRVMLNQVQDV